MLSSATDLTTKGRPHSKSISQSSTCSDPYEEGARGAQPLQRDASSQSPGAGGQHSAGQAAAAARRVLRAIVRVRLLQPSTMPLASCAMYGKLCYAMLCYAMLCFAVICYAATMPLGTEVVWRRWATAGAVWTKPGWRNRLKKARKRCECATMTIDLAGE